MPIFILSLLLQVALIVHVVRTGRNTLWIWVLVLLPLAGALAYFFVEVLPELMGSQRAQGAWRGARKVVDPRRDLRKASANAAMTDSVAAKALLGREQCHQGDYAAAMETFRSGLKGLYEFDPTLLLGLAEAQYASADFPAARASLEALREHNPDFASSDGHLLYARALESCGDLTRAESEYRAVAAYYPGAEAKVRHAVLLNKVGRHAEAREALDDVLKTAELAPRHVRRAQAEWIDLARRELKS
jgi:hypothetical protein